MTRRLVLLGLDIAALYSGAAVLQATVAEGELSASVLEERHLRTERIAANQPPSWESMLSVANQAVDMVRAHDVTHIVYEGYAKGGFGGRKNKAGKTTSANTTGYEQAELVGVIKHALYSCGRTLMFLQVPPTSLPSFYGTKAGDKKAVQQVVKEQLGFESRQRYSKWRTDCADAAAHALIGAHVFHMLAGWEPAELQDSMRRQLLGDARKSGIIGLLHRPHLYIPRTACVAEGDDNGCQEEG